MPGGSDLSIICVVLNDPIGLRRTLVSIFLQKVHPKEVVIIDSSSSDAVYREAYRFKHSLNIRYLKQPRQGIYAAMNLGGTQSTARWLWFINAGDFLLNENVIRDVSEDLIQSQDIGVYAGGVEVITQNGFLYDSVFPHLENLDDRKIGNFHHQGCIFRSSTFNDLGGYDVSYRYASDGDLIDRYLGSRNFTVSARFLVGFVLGGASGKNMRALFAEIERYRPRRFNYLERNWILFKNIVRNFTTKRHGMLLEKGLLSF